MIRNIVGMGVFVGLLLVCSSATPQETKKPFTIIGELKVQKNTPDGKNTTIEVLAPGEEKARSYHVSYDPKIKGPMPAILAAVRAAKIGERIEMECLSTNHGPAIVSFRVLKKGGEPKDK